MGGFHLEKVVYVCCGKFPENTGVDKVLTENEVFGRETVNSVMEGKNDVLGSRRMARLSETLYQFLSEHFTSNETGEIYINEPVTKRAEV